jgi:hypothetical protein
MALWHTMHLAKGRLLSYPGRSLLSATHAMELMISSTLLLVSNVEYPVGQ